MQLTNFYGFYQLLSIIGFINWTSQASTITHILALKVVIVGSFKSIHSMRAMMISVWSIRCSCHSPVQYE